MSNKTALLDAIKAIGHDLKESGVEAVPDAVADIRHKVVEEGWLGRQITPDRQAMEPDPADTDDYDKWLAERYGKETQPQERGQEREKEEDRDIET